ncbi:ferric iron permease FTR1-like protein [Glomus cerebriforme]|uniref:Ferric iron permease FTR1-like protein n=1 Tax=Glomus cerebriforme TaxID=658196 RepID=A0A397SVZ7_9GLOM|nr:ferric iron permease FTR1-like protein [Glomus cerebriforme]
MVYLFDVPAYFILLRETLEITIILAVLLGLIDKFVPDNDTLRKKFKKQIWIGTAAGLGTSLLIGVIFVIIFYTLEKNLWEDSEAAWEGAFSLVASVVITIMSLSMLRVKHWKTKWEGKLQTATEQHLEKHDKGNKWALILLPFTVVCREIVESIVFIAGIGFQHPATGLPIPVITGILSGFFIGYIIYKGSHKLSLNVFFGVTTVLLLFIAAGLFSNSIYELQEATEDPNVKIVWELKCCDPETDSFWSIMKALFGWRNVATVGSTVGYFMYWFVVGLLALFLVYKERKNNRNAEFKDQPSPSINDNADEKDEQVVMA